MKVFVFAFLAFAFSTVKEVKAKVDPATAAALAQAGAGVQKELINAGAKLLHGHPDTNAWQLKNGKVIDADKCWQDGGGACPNGNCLDNKGRRGEVVGVKTVNCKWYCLWTANCQVQFCCETTCLKKQWIGDGYCDDENNNAECDYDGGDCCGNSRSNWNKHCQRCTCLDPKKRGRLLKYFNKS